MLFARSGAPALLTAPPEELVAAGFRRDDAERLAAWQRLVASDTPTATLLDSVRRIADPQDRAIALVRGLGRGGYAPGCGSLGPLATKLVAVRTGHGCCSDHTELFLGLANLAGLSAREVSTSHHTIAEFYHPPSGTWRFIDPTYGIMARAPEGSYLALAEMRDRARQELRIDFLFVGTAVQRAALLPGDFAWFYLGASAYETLSVTWGDNVYSAEVANPGKWLPGPAAQLTGHLVGATPGYRVFFGETASTGFRAMALVMGLLAVAASGCCVAWLVQRWTS